MGSFEEREEKYFEKYLPKIKMMKCIYAQIHEAQQIIKRTNTVFYVTVKQFKSNVRNIQSSPKETKKTYNFKDTKIRLITDLTIEMIEERK